MNKPEDSQASWHQLTSRIARLMRRGHDTAALAEVDAFLEQESSPKVRCQALSLRASIKERTGEWEQAMEDLLEAYFLSEALSEARYCCELCLADVSKQMGRLDAAATWYRRALATCRDAQGLSALPAADGLCLLRGEENLTPEERSLCNEALTRMGEEEKLELEWLQLERRLAAGLKSKRADDLAAIDAFLARPMNSELLRQVLSFRSILREKQRDFEGAKQDALRAHSLVGPGYSRYTCELWLGFLCRKREHWDEALSWDRAALESSLQAEDVSGASAVKSFLELRGQANLTPEERTLCEAVLRRSWEVLALEGTLDLIDLSKTASILIEAGGSPQLGTKSQ